MPSAADQETASPALAPVREVFTAIVSTIVPEASALDSQGWINLEQLVEAALRDRPDALKRQLRLSLRGIQWMAVLRYGKPFTSLNAAQRVRFLSSLENHRLQIIRVGFWGLRTLALLGYYARPEAAREIGYEADARGWERPGIGTAEKQKL
ncbi:MAG: gluconate 2-dehydrogenase subunit 3 family protein [Acidobacteriia bacterium]|nr:gluconate 2-dehydrogenase subunit 3 family protein [Terriglobia bacterium]